MSETATQTINRTDLNVKEPERYKVVILNDNATPMEFVIELLKLIFHLNHDGAVAVMLNVHQLGKGTAGIYTYEVAEQKAMESTQL